MRVAAYKLGGDGLDDVREIKGALLLCHSGVEHDLQQEVAKLILQPGQIVASDSVGDLIGFLKRVGAMVRKFCSRSHGQPLPGVRRAAMISIRREMSREGFTRAEKGCGVRGT